MQPKATSKATKGVTDYRLVIATLEKRILSGDDDDKIRKVLASEEIWKNLPPELMMQWASLCQMAGCISSADSVYSELHVRCPELVRAWDKHLEMLDILGRNTEILKILELSKRVAPGTIHSAWVKRFSKSSYNTHEKDIVEASRPFTEMRSRQALTQNYLELFCGRPDCFARQWADKENGKSGYFPVRYPMRIEDLEAHFKGFETCGIYLVHQDGTVKLGVIDADLKENFRDAKTAKKNLASINKEGSWMASRLLEIAEKSGIRPCIEYSGGKGFHFWFFFKDYIPAGQAKAFLSDLAGQIRNDLEFFELEIFPKQENLTGKGFGNLIKLPLGVHRKSGRRSYFYECSDKDIDAQLTWLTKVKPGMISTVPEKRARIEPHPRFMILSEKWPELALLSSSCPPIGRLVTACFSGNELTGNEEQVLYQTIGFLQSAKRNLHALFGNTSEYNPNMVDLKISRLKGSPLGCRRIHSILGYTGDYCAFPQVKGYSSPLMHLGINPGEAVVKSEKIEGLSAAIENLKTAMEQVERYLK